MSRTARISVEIQTFNGIFRRVSDPVIYPNDLAVARQGLFAYPDLRCTKFVLYVQDGEDDELWREHSIHKSSKSSVNNMAYAALDVDADWYVPEHQIDLTVMPAEPTSIREATFDAWNEEMDYDPNRVAYSEASRPREFKAKGVLYTGDGRDDRVMGFGANTLPVSEGQFGFFPMYVLNRHSITPLQVTDDATFAPTEPISTHVGLVSRYGVVNLDRAVAIASDEGIYLVSGELTKISQPLDSHYGEHFEVFDGRDPVWARQSLRGKMGPDTALGYFSNRELSVRELWVGTSEGAYIFSLDHNRWFTASERTRTQFLSFLQEPTAAQNIPRLLYSIGPEEVWEEASRVNQDGTFNTGPYGEDIFVLETSRLGLGFDDLRCRIRRMSIRQRNPVCYLKWQLIEALEEYPPDAGPEIGNEGRIVVREGVRERGKHKDTWNMGFTKARNPILRLEGKGAAHHALESFLFIVRPLYPERLETGNYQHLSPDVEVT